MFIVIQKMKLKASYLKAILQN